MGPYVNQSAASLTAAEEAEDARLAAARDAFPAWLIVEMLGGFAAVPAGTEVVDSFSLDGLVRKLRERGAL